MEEKKVYKMQPKNDVDGRYARETGENAVPGINTPGVNLATSLNKRLEEHKQGIHNPNIALPAFNPPVPNRAWTAMRQGLDIDELNEEEKREMYLGRDDIF